MCHFLSPFPARLKVEAAFTRSIGERLDASVIEIAAAVEHDVLDTFFLGPLGDQLADFLGRSDVCASLGALAHWLFDRRSGNQCRALHVIDELGVDVLGRTKYGQPCPSARRKLYLASHRRCPPRGPVSYFRHRVSLLLLPFLTYLVFVIFFHPLTPLMLITPF